MNTISTLLDEQSDPPLRAVLGQLLTNARTTDIAITHLRFAGVDFTASEAAGIQRLRVLLGHVDAASLLDSWSDVSAGHARATLLAAFARSGRLEIRTAPHHNWMPDFSVFHGLPGDRTAALVGAHYFGLPYPRFGLALTCVTTEPRAIRMCRDRFQELWDAGYDVLPVVLDTLDRLLA